MKYDSILWNTLIKNITEKEYIKQHNYLFNKDEYLSEKLKKYKYNVAKRDLEDELTPYHTFIAQARLAMNNNITVYKLTNEIIETIKNTTIQEIPKDEPIPVKNVFIIESHDPNKCLFGDIDAIIGYYCNLVGKEIDMIEYKKNDYVLSILFHVKSKDDENWYKAAIRLNDSTQREKVLLSYTGANLFSFIPPLHEEYSWLHKIIDYDREVLFDKKFCNKCIQKNECKIMNKNEILPNYCFCYKGLLDNILSFSIIFNYLLLAENAPLKEKRTVEYTNYTINKKGKIIEKKQEWITKYLYLDETKMDYEKETKYNELDKDNLKIINSNVKGHWRYQAYGPEFSERRLIYIKQHQTKKWIKDGDTKIIVKKRMK